jgi:hypothetical protein
MRPLLLASVLIWGCGSAALPVPTTPDLELCYFRAEDRASVRRGAECPAGREGWLQCPARPAILAELQSAQEACK